MKICYHIQKESTILIKKIFKWGVFQTLSGYINYPFGFGHLLRKAKAKLMYSDNVNSSLTYRT